MADCVAKSSLGSRDKQGEIYIETMVGRTLADVERALILATLRYHRGNRTHAANMLGISIRSMRNRIRRYRSDGGTVPEAAAGRVANAASTYALGIPA